MTVTDPALVELYRQQRGPVAFVDESYRPEPRDGRPAFYTMTAVTVAVDELTTLRARLIELAGRRFWHTTEAFQEGRERTIAAMASVLADRSVWNVLTVDLPIRPEPGALERGRATCLAALTREVTRGSGDAAVRLIVADRNADPALNRADQQVMTVLRAAGDVDRHVTLHHGRMRDEPVLWAADLASWSAYRALSVDDGRWIAPLRDVLTVLDARTGIALDMEQPQAAAAPDAVAPSPGVRQPVPSREGAVVAQTTLPGTDDTRTAFTRGTSVLDHLVARVAALRREAGHAGVVEGNTPRALLARAEVLRVAREWEADRATTPSAQLDPTRPPHRGPALEP